MSAVTMKVFKLDDCDWRAGESLDACIKAARDHCGDGSYCDAEDEGYELDAEAMATLKFIDDDGSTRTFAEHLAKDITDGSEFPRLFASTEY